MRNILKRADRPDLRGTPKRWAVPLHSGRVTHCVRVAHYTPLEAELAVKRRLEETGTVGLFKQIGRAQRTSKQVLA